MKRKRRSKEKTGCQHEKEAAVKGKDLLLWEAAVKGKDLRSGGPWGPLIKYYSAPGCGGLRGLQQRGEGGRMGPPSRESQASVASTTWRERLEGCASVTRVSSQRSHILRLRDLGASVRDLNEAAKTCNMSCINCNSTSLLPKQACRRSGVRGTNEHL